MILGIGTDIVDISRFQSWAQAPQDRLLKIFSDQELEQCRVGGGYDPEKLAARFAAKEAFYKALSATLCDLSLTSHTFSLMFASQHVHVVLNDWGVPMLDVVWESFEEKIQSKLPKLHVHVSLAHEQQTAIAFVIIERID